jgi:DNA-directed RNA polymerase subunit RPC12/RpoP
LLEGEESQAGQPVNCPVCQMLFLVPAPITAPAAAVESPAETRMPAFAPPDVAREPDLLHIPCPKGHELEVPRDMLGQEVLCPHCNAQFLLKERDSVESKRRHEEEQARRDIRLGNAWLNWAIIVAVLVVLGLIIMIASGS